MQYGAAILFAIAGTAHAIEEPGRNPAVCRGGNPHEMNACEKARFDFYDRLMNRLYRRQMDYLQHEPANRELKRRGGFKTDYAALLRKSQRQWLRFRDADCAYVAGPDEEGGSGWPQHHYACMAERTRTRALELESYVGCRHNGCNW